MPICFDLSQWYFLKFAYCTNDGVETQRNIGTACSSRSVDRTLSHYTITNETTGADAISYAIKNKILLLLMINDYTAIHSHRRPTALATRAYYQYALVEYVMLFCKFSDAVSE